MTHEYRPPVPMLATAALLATGAALADVIAADLQLDLVTVTVTAAPDTPARTLDLLLGDALQQAPRLRLDELLPRVPGVRATNRGSFAQEEQITIRGFGARSGFGTRGVRVIVDDIPATMPDGQGGVGLIGLGTVGSIEVTRGPFSVLAGNHGGGVVRVTTADAPARPKLWLRLFGGADATWQSALGFGGEYGGGRHGLMAGIMEVSQFETAGYRDWSNARKELFNARLSTELPGGGALRFVVNALDQPLARDPLGLTAAQVRADPRQSQPAAPLFRAGRQLGNEQGGVSLVQPFGADASLHVTAWAGGRRNTQYLAVPLPAQLAITASGGVSAFSRQFHGLGLRWEQVEDLGGGPLTLTLGAEYEHAGEDRTGHLNEFGRRGALKRDETNRVNAEGALVQARWQPLPRWHLDAGLRHSRVAFRSRDRFVCEPGRVTAPGTRPETCSGAPVPISATNRNPDDSGALAYAAWSSAVGLAFAPLPNLTLCASAGRGFETPTLIELAYRPDGGAGLNLDLAAAVSSHYEVGARLQPAAGGRLEFALFAIDTEDELAVATNQGGRVTYQNAPRSQRRGAELLLDLDLGGGFSGLLAATLLDARFSSAFSGCTATPCRTLPPMHNAAPITAGNRIPGVPTYTLFGDLGYRHDATGLDLGLTLSGQGPVPVNDLNSAEAAAFWRLDLRAGLTRRWGALEWSQFVRVDNLLDRATIGAVVVNDANERFYAPAPGRTYSVGLTLNYEF